MTTARAPRFNLAALRERAGEKVFARGEAYFADERVQILAIDARQVLAEVDGTEDYHTKLIGSGKAIGGECSCPAFEDWGFCKHMVATALAANAAGVGTAVEGKDTLSRIRAHLGQNGAVALIDMIVELAQGDPVLFRKLDIASAHLNADDKTLEARMRKAIDAATRTRGFIDYREARNWAAGVDAALDSLDGLASGPRAGIVLKLAARALERVETAINSIDDSDGYCGGLMERIQEIHLAAALSSRPEPVTFARDLYRLEMDGEFDTFTGAAELYADVLGQDGLAEYRRLALEDWDALPPRVGPAPSETASSADMRRLKEVVDFFADKDGDVEARIALRAKDLSSPWDYIELARFCLSQGREDEALRRAEEGLWIFEDGRPDEQLVFFTVDLLTKRGRPQDAEAHLRRAFEKSPSLELYARLRDIGGSAARDQALGVLQARLAEVVRTRFNFPADLFIRILMRESMLDAAWSVVEKHGASASLQESLARVSEATHPHQALRVYVDRIDRLVEGGGDDAYAKAAGLITRAAALQGAEAHTRYVLSIRQRFGRKRNFMKLLG